MILSRAGEYATFKQWESLGGIIKKGAKAETVVFWATESTRKEKDEDGNEIIKVILFEHPILRYYHVFHINDVDGVTPLQDKSLENGNAETFDNIETAENIINEYVARENMPNHILAKRQKKDGE